MLRRQFLYLLVLGYNKQSKILSAWISAPVLCNVTPSEQIVYSVYQSFGRGPLSKILVWKTPQMNFEAAKIEIGEICSAKDIFFWLRTYNSKSFCFE